MFDNAKARMQAIWRNIRRLSGDDAYEQYLKHYFAVHADNADASEPLSREAFFKAWQDKKWKGINRCC